MTLDEWSTDTEVLDTLADVEVQPRDVRHLVMLLGITGDRDARLIVHMKINRCHHYRIRAPRGTLSRSKRKILVSTFWGRAGRSDVAPAAAVGVVAMRDAAQISSADERPFLRLFWFPHCLFGLPKQKRR